jgi:hypothetical protein
VLPTPSNTTKKPIRKKTIECNQQTNKKENQKPTTVTQPNPTTVTQPYPPPGYIGIQWEPAPKGGYYQKGPQAWVEVWGVGKPERKK